MRAKLRPERMGKKPEPSGKSCLDCTDKHTLEAQVKKVICKHACHKFQGY